LGADNVKLFARNTRFLRKAAGIAEKGSPFSQTELAKRLGVSKKSVINWESGKAPHRSNLEKIAATFSKILGFTISPQELITGDLTEKIELVPRNELERELSPEQRKILRSIFLSAGYLDKTKLLKVVDFIDKIKNE